MFLAARRFVGRDLPSRIDPFDVETYFSLAQDDIQAIREGFRKHQHIVALQLTVLRATGRHLNRAARISPFLLNYFARVFGVSTVEISTPRSVYRNAHSTLTAHQKWVRDHAGFKDYSEAVETELSAYLDTVARGSSDIDHLVHESAIWLFERKVIIPGDRRLRDSARVAFATVEAQAIEIIEAIVPRPRWPNLLARLYEKLPSSGTTRIEWLKQRQGKHSKTRIDEVQDRVDYLRGLEVHQWSLEPLTIEFQRARAKAYSDRPPSHSRTRIESTQILEAVCFLKVNLAELADEFLQRTGRRARPFRGAKDADENEVRKRKPHHGSQDQMRVHPSQRQFQKRT